MESTRVRKLGASSLSLPASSAPVGVHSGYLRSGPHELGASSFLSTTQVEHFRRRTLSTTKVGTLRATTASRRPLENIALYQPRRLEHSRRPQHRGDRWKPRGWNTPGDHSGARRHMNARLSVMPRRFHTCLCSWFLASAMTVLKGRLSVRGFAPLVCPSGGQCFSCHCLRPRPATLSHHDLPVPV